MTSKGLTQVEAADRLRISTSWLRQLTERGEISRNSDGTYPWPQVAEEFDEYQESLHEKEPDATYDEARTRKALVDALLKEDELAVRRGELVPMDRVLGMVREPLEQVDAQLRTAVRRHSKAWADRLGISQAEAMALMHEIIEDVRTDLREVFENGDDREVAA